DRTQGRTAIEVPAFDTYGSPTKEFSQFLDRVSAPIQEIDERERVAEQARLAEAARVEAEAEAARVEADRAHRAAREAEAAARVAAENQKESMAEYRSTINSKFMPYLDNYEAYFKEDSKFGDPERPFCREADPDHYIAVTKDFRSPTSPPFKLYTQDGAEVEMFGPDGNIKPEVQEIVDALFEKYPAFIATKQEKVKAASAEKDKENLQRVEEHFGSKIEDARRLAGHFYGDDLDQEERDGVLVEEIEEKETPDVLEFLEVREAAIAKARETLNEEQIAAATAQGFEIYDDEGALNEEDILAFVGKEIIAQEKGEEVETPTLDALSAQKAAEATRESDDRKMAQAMAKEVLEEAEAGIAETKTRHLTDDVVHDPEVAAVIAALRGKELQTETQDSVVGRLQRTESRDTLPIAEEALEDGSVKDVLDAISTGTAEVPTGYADSKVALLASPTRDNLNSALSEMVGGGDSLAWGVKDFRTQAEAIGAKIDGNKVTMPAVTVPGAKGPIRFVLVLDDDGKVSETELHGGAKTMFGGEKKRDLAVGDQVKPKHVSEVDSLVSAYEKMLGVETITKESSHSSFVDMVDRGKESHHGPTFAGRSGKEGMVR
ncbi:MAG: hypothetical protein GY909_16980, partial [Oligoflexia bacterium]|nr:hypothetical protein [Oligoflexia bacterium]